MSSTLCSMWLLSVVALLAVDIRTGALQQRDMGPRRCHQCIRSNVTSCEQPSEWSLTTCNADQPYCATTAVGPDFVSTLSCATSNIPTCTLRYSENQNMELACICTDSNCNVPFTRKLRSELVKFSYANVNNSNGNFTQEFFKFIDTNITDINLYKRITVGLGTNDVKNVTRLTTVAVPTVTIMALRHTIGVLPRVEALKQNAATPSDDDEDESEGSGSYEETRSHQAAAPAAPSSFLPANDNKATALFTNILLFIPILVYLV